MGKADWVKTLDRFYKDFAKTLETAEKNMDGTKIKVPDEETDVVCELCGRKMVIKTADTANFWPAPDSPNAAIPKKLSRKLLASARCARERFWPRSRRMANPILDARITLSAPL